MGIDNNPLRLIESNSQHHIGSFARNSRQEQKLLHRARNRASEFIQNHPAGSLDAFGLVAEKACRPDILLQLFRWNYGIISRSAIFSEQMLRYGIHPLIRALCREDRGHQQFEGVMVPERASGVRIGFLEYFKYLRNSMRLSGSRFFPWHNGDIIKDFEILHTRRRS